MVAIGEMRRRITIQRFGYTVEPEGTVVENWTEVATVWAARGDLSDSEKLAGYGPVSTLVTRFTVRDTAVSRGFLAEDRVLHDGREWEVTGIKETRDGQGRFLEITTKTTL